MLILFPAHPREFTLAHFAVLPLEWPLAVLCLLAIGTGPASNVLRAGLVLLLGLAVLLRIADLGSFAAFDRPFSPLVEWHLIGDGWNLASGSIGTGEAALAVAAALAVLAALCIALYRGMGAIGRLRGGSRRVAALGAGALAAIALTVLIARATLPERVPTTWPVRARLVPEFVDRSKAMRRSVVDQQAFVAELVRDPLDASPPPTFAALDGRDLIVLFVESYGQSFLVDEDLGRIADARLSEIGERTAAAGLSVRSGWLTSPIRGGRSWMAHATFASGLRIDNQARYDRLISSRRRSLYRLLGTAGFATAGLNPAIVDPWPEGAWYGYDAAYDVHDLGYAGLRFGWATMPDQYTLSFFEHTVRRPAPGPVAGELALISSHAPWAPIPRRVPWEDVGDGAIFDGSHRFGDPVIWAQRQRVRELYAQSLDYALATIGEYVARHGENALVIVLGDHQPASIIAGWGRTADVPVHVFADDPALLDRLPSDTFTDGMRPHDDAPALPMQGMRELLSTRFEAVP